MTRAKNVTQIATDILKQEVRLSLALIVCAIAVVVTGLIPPQLLRILIDTKLMAGESQGLLSLAILYVFVLFAIGLADFLKGFVLTTLGQKITKAVRSEALSKMHRLDPLYFTKAMEGDTVSRIINDPDAVDVLFTGGIVSMLIDLLKIVGITGSVFILSPNLGLVALILIPVIAVITRLFQKNMLIAQKRSRALIGRISQRITEALRNRLVIKANGKEGSILDRFSITLTQLYKAQESINALDSLYPVTIQITRALAIAAMVMAMINRQAWLGISIGSLAAAIDLISNLFDPIENVGSELQSIQQAIAAISRINDYLGEKEETPRDPDFDIQALLKQKATLVFDQVSFAYEDETIVLKGIDLTVNAGDHVTFVGRTGVGKSTLLKLVLGLLPPQSGLITFNGVDVSSIPHTVQRQLYGSVDQNFPLIKGSLRQQITLNDPSIDESMIVSALTQVGLADLMTKHPKGMDALIPDELGLSEGQKQLIAIARAIVTQPPILILDEISSGLDSVSDARIKSVIQTVSRDKIVLSVTHRLGSIEDEESVVILQEGSITAYGSMKDLRKHDPWLKKALALERLNQK